MMQGHKKPSQQCAAILETAIKECHTLKEKHPDLITYTCSAHLVNLVEKEVNT